MFPQEAWYPYFFWKNQAPHYFFRKKWIAFSFVQKKIKHIIISSKKNEASHYFLIKNADFFSEEIMRHLIVSEKKEALHCFWRNNEAIDFLTEEIMITSFFKQPCNNNDKHKKHTDIHKQLHFSPSSNTHVNQSLQKVF